MKEFWGQVNCDVKTHSECVLWGSATLKVIRRRMNQGQSRGLFVVFRAFSFKKKWGPWPCAHVLTQHSFRTAQNYIQEAGQTGRLCIEAVAFKAWWFHSSFCSLFPWHSPTHSGLTHRNHFLDTPAPNLCSFLALWNVLLPLPRLSGSHWHTHCTAPTLSRANFSTLGSFTFPEHEVRNLTDLGISRSEPNRSVLTN